jgi:transaldolase
VVTTNPTLLAKEGAEPMEQLKKICEIIDALVSREVIKIIVVEMVKEACELSKTAPNIVIKRPFLKECIKAVKILEPEVIKTNVILVFSQTQVLIAAKAGTSYISLFIGRLMDNGQNEIDFLKE